MVFLKSEFINAYSTKSQDSETEHVVIMVYAGHYQLMMENIDKQILSAFKLQVLGEQRVILCECIRPDRHFPYLRSIAVLSLEDCQEISAERTSSKQAGKFLDIMVTKGPIAYDSLCKSILMDKTQMHLLERLNTQYEMKKNSYLALVNPDLQLHGRNDINVDRRALPRPNSSDV